MTPTSDARGRAAGVSDPSHPTEPLPQSGGTTHGARPPSPVRSRPGAAPRRRQGFGPGPPDLQEIIAGTAQPHPIFMQFPVCLPGLRPDLVLGLGEFEASRDDDGVTFTDGVLRFPTRKVRPSPKLVGWSQRPGIRRRGSFRPSPTPLASTPSRPRRPPWCAPRRGRPGHRRNPPAGSGEAARSTPTACTRAGRAGRSTAPTRPDLASAACAPGRASSCRRPRLKRAGRRQRLRPLDGGLRPGLDAVGGQEPPVELLDA